MPNNLIIAGGRDFTDTNFMIAQLSRLEELGIITPETVVLCGMAKGADLMGRALAQKAGLTVRDMPAEWDLLGKRAGFARNEAMGLIADQAIVFWDGESRGSQHMIGVMDKLEKPVYVCLYNQPK